MKYQKIVLLIILLLLSGSIYAQTTPEEVVNRFCTMRFEGTDFKNQNEYDKLKLYGNHIPEPGWDKCFVVDTFAIVSSKVDGYTAFVDVSYKTLGIYGGDIWTPKDTTEISHYYLANTVEGWKIDRLSIDNPRVSLDYILTIIPETIEDSYKFMQNYKSNKGEYEEMLKMNNDREKSLKQLMELSNKRKQEKY